MKKPTIKDVARLSNTFVRTVSRVLNEHPNVKESTRKRVKNIIEELDFKTNFLAKGLKERKTNQIVIFVDQRSGDYWGAYHNEVFHEIHRITKQSEYRLVLSPSSPDSFHSNENDGFHLVKHNLCDDAIIFDPVKDDQRIMYLKTNKIPFLLIGDSEHDFEVPYVGIDNVQVGYSETQALYTEGYRSIALLLGNTKSIINMKRATGYRNFCKEHGLKETVYHHVYSLESAYKTTTDILRTKLIDAIFISGDERALAVYQAIKEFGLTIGKDIGVLDIDNIKMNKYFYPPLSTISQPKYEIARAAVDLLIRQMNSNKNSIHHPELKPTLVKRASY
ncbi:MAG: LacI family transcriptional regulator [Virgibacillus proomii]